MLLSRTMLREGLTVTGGTPAAPMTVVRHSSGQSFFLIDDVAGSEPAPPKRGGRLRIYWDRSLSHRGDRTDLEADVLVRLAERSAPAAIDLVTFASDRPVVTTLDGAAALRAALGNVTYRGGTSIGRLDTLPLAPATQCVLVSDGMTTIAPDCRLDALTASTGADGARLGRLVQRTGGAVVRLSAGGEDSALTALASHGVSPISVRDDAGRPIDVRILPAGRGRWLMVGPMPAGSVMVRLADGSERRYAPGGAPIAADAPGVLWAADRVAALADDPTRHVAMAETARRFQVAGPGMSFLVLERPDQYLKADLTPPPGFGTEWMARYAEAKASSDKEHRDDREKRLTFVLEQWRQRRA